MSLHVLVGNNIFLSAALDDQIEDKFIRASLFKPDGTILTERTLTHKSRGLYTDNGYQMPSAYENLTVLYEAYDDAGFTTISDYGVETEIINKKTNPVIQNSADQNIVGFIDDDDLVGTIENEEVLIGSIDQDDLVGKIDDVDLVGNIEDNELTGFIDEDC